MSEGSTGETRRPHREDRIHFSARFPPYLVYLVVGGIGALLLCFLTPPFEVPDEPQHFYRSFQLSELDVWGAVQDGAPGTILPSSLPELVEHFLGTRVSHTRRLLMPHPWTDTWAQFGRPLAPERREFVEFGAITYAPFNYVPQALGVGVMRMFGAPPLADLYAARIANAIAAVAMMTWALRLIPVGREAALAAALLPMWQFMIGSASPDAMILSSAFIATAIGLRFYDNARWSVRDMVVMALAGTLLCVIKPVYLPLLLIGLPAALPSRRDTPHLRREKIMLMLYHAIVVAVVMGATLAWMRLNASLAITASGRPTTDINVGRQIAFIASHPLDFVRILARTFVQGSGDYIRQAIGVLGWLYVFLPTWLYVSSLAAFLVGALFPLAGRALPHWWVIAWAAVLIGASAVLVEAALYVGWTGVGGPVVDGVQGRYFLPMLPLAGVTIASSIIALRGGKGTQWGYPILVACAVLVTFGTLWVVAADYCVFLTWPRLI